MGIVSEVTSDHDSPVDLCATPVDAAKYAKGDVACTREDAEQCIQQADEFLRAVTPLVEDTT